MAGQGCPQSHKTLAAVEPADLQCFPVDCLRSKVSDGNEHFTKCVVTLFPLSTTAELLMDPVNFTALNIYSCSC